MGEKEIVEDYPGIVGPGQQGPTSSTGTPPLTGGSGTGGGVGVPGGGGGGGTPPKTGGGGGVGDSGSGGGAADCADIEFKMRPLKEELEALRQKNQELADQTANAFQRYSDAIKAAKITEAVVDSNNAVGKALIETALFAAGGYGGIAKSLGVGGETATQLFGSGIYGSKDAASAIQGIGAFVSKQAGVDVPNAKEVAGGALSGMADAAKNAVLDGIANWMKDGALSAEQAAAKDQYADFVGKATATNAAAAGMADLKRQLDALAAEAKAKNCPPEISDVPNPLVRTIEIAPYGQGAITGEKGPNWHRQQLDGNNHSITDMFKAGTTKLP